MKNFANESDYLIELMRRNNEKIEQYRLQHSSFATTKADGNNGLFTIQRNGKVLRCIVSDALGWDHVSVSIEKGKYPPTWDMCFIKDLFFDEEETVIQYHPPKSCYVNVHPGVLHMWRQQGVTIPLPPIVMV
jgi:hypothetical protein